MIHTDIYSKQQKLLTESASLGELLAALIIGGIGMVISLSSRAADDPIVYALGLIIMAFAAGWIAMKCISAFLDVRDRLRKNRN